MQKPIVACILVNWNNWRDTADCLTSLEKQDYPNLRVIVVDNASTNDSLAQLQIAHPWATYVPNSENAGFPKACNLGARHPLAAEADFLWFLNNDTVAPPDTTSKLVATALSNPKYGVTGAVLRYAHDPTQVQAWGGGQINLWSAYNWHYRTPTPFGPDSYITFASALIRRDCFNQLDGLFEGVFMYFEDVDFCLRAHRARWQLAVSPETAILHKEGGSSANGTKARNQTLERIVTVSGLTFLGRHALVPAVAQANFLLLRIAKRLIRLDWPSLRAVFEGVNDFHHNRRRPQGLS